MRKDVRDWQEDAVCFSIPGFTELRTPAQREVCTKCPVIDQCLRYGLQSDAKNADDLPTTQTAAMGWPVYGGLTVLERVALAKTQTEATAA